jgi:hypothetical protein
MIILFYRNGVTFPEIVIQDDQATENKAMDV